MLQRYKAKLTGPYTPAERAEIDAVTGLILGSALTFYPSKPLTPLERDYARFIRVAAFHYSGPSFILAGLSFLFIDQLPWLNRLRGGMKWTVKVAAFGFFYIAGVREIRRKVLEFPLLDEVIVEGIIKYTKWIEIPPDAVLENRKTAD